MSVAPKNKEAMQVYTKLVRAADSVTARTTREMTAAGLSISQFGVMEALLNKGPLCQRDIAAKILKSTGNITMVIDNLEKRGLVRRERDAQDRRYLTVHLTDEGRSMIEEVFEKVSEAIGNEFAILSKTEKDELARLCRMVGLQERRK